jgi:Zn-dependent protease with chaperone function
LLSSPCLAQVDDEPPHKPYDVTESRDLDFEIGRAAAADRALMSRSPEFKPVRQNDDRIHLQLDPIGASALDMIEPTLVMPRDWPVKRAIELHKRLMKALNEDVVDATVTKTPEAMVVSGFGRPKDWADYRRRANQRWPGATPESEGVIDWPAIQTALRDGGVSRAEIRIFTGDRTLVASACGMKWTIVEVVEQTDLTGPSHYAAAVLDTNAKVSRMSFREATVNPSKRLGAVLIGAFLILPTLFLLLVRSWALSRAPDPGAYQIYARASRSTSIVATVAYILVTGSPHLRAAEAAVFSGPSSFSMIAGPLFVLLGVILAPRLCAQLCSFSVQQRFRGIEYSAKDVRKRVLQLGLLIVAPALVCFVLGVFAPWAPLQALALIAGLVLLFVAPFIVNRMGATRLRADSGVHAAPGDLLRRVTDLAARAGVTIRAVTIIPANQSRIANGFATSNGAIALTDYLIQQLTRGEVDAVVAHEIGHLKRPHLPRIALAHLAGLLLWLALFAVSARLSPDRNVQILGSLSVWFVPMLVRHRVSRRNELEADAAGVELTQDPENYIRMLAKAAAAGVQPLTPGRTSEATSTHPGGARRIMAVATRFGIEQSRVDQLVQDAQADLRQPAPGGDHYDITATFAPTNRLFTAAFRKRYTSQAAASGKIAAVVAAVVCICIWIGVPLPGPLATAALTSVLLFICLTALLVGMRAANIASMSAMRIELQAALQARYGLPLGWLAHVGYSPGAEVRYYSGDSSWDAGFLGIWQDRIVFLGDACCFEILPEQVAGAKIGWYRIAGGARFPRIYVTWRALPSMPEQVFSLEVRDGRNIAAIRRLTARLLQTIELWRNGSPVQPLAFAAPAGLGCPGPADSEGLKAPEIVPFFWLHGFVTVLTATYGAALLYIAAERVAGKPIFIWLSSKCGIVMIGWAIFSVAGPLYEKALKSRRGRSGEQSGAGAPERA